jgi:hypothetical protein
MARLIAMQHDEAVRLLLKINARFPYIPIFPPSSNSDQPSSSSKPAENDLPAAPPAAAVPTVTESAQDTHQQQPPPENHYDGYETDPPAHYPKPGNGLARTLPPESEDVPWLLDDNFDVFQQIDYRGQQQQQAAEASTAVPETNGEAQATAGAEGLTNVDAS